MAEEITLAVLTRGRFEDVIQCITTARATATGKLKVVVVVDDDIKTYTGLEQWAGSRDNVKVVYLHPRHYYVRGMNALYKHVDTEYFVVSNDDVSFTHQGWDERALTAVRKCGGIVELAGPDLCAHYITSRTFIDLSFDGLLAEPAYTFYCSDTELRNRARVLGAYHFLPESGLVHHVKNDRVRSDASYWMATDRETFKRRWQSEWPAEVWQ